MRRFWYKGEPLRIFPNIEIISTDEGAYWVSAYWLKFVLLEFQIKL